MKTPVWPTDVLEWVGEFGRGQRLKSRTAVAQVVVHSTNNNQDREGSNAHHWSHSAVVGKVFFAAET